MKIACKPSQVIRLGRDLNQQGHAGRQEQASSSSPVTFHGVFFAAAAALLGTVKAAKAHRTTPAKIDLRNRMVFITFFFFSNFQTCGRSLVAEGQPRSRLKIFPVCKEVLPSSGSPALRRESRQVF